MKAKVLVFSNFKGGAGKTSTGALVAWELAHRGNKVLVVDFDSQQNMTDFFLRTKAELENQSSIETDNTVLTAIYENKSLKEVAIPITSNLDLVPTSMYFQKEYQSYLEVNYPLNIDSQEKARKAELNRVKSLKPKIDEVRPLYDYIFLDVPPSISSPNDTVFYACDDVIIVLQTQERSFSGAQNFIKYLQDFIIDDMDGDVGVLGVIPVLSKKNGQVDETILADATSLFDKSNMFKTRIYLQERIKRMDMTGITNHDIWDKRVHKTFAAVTDEIIQRLKDEEKDE